MPEIMEAQSAMGETGCPPTSQWPMASRNCCSAGRRPCSAPWTGSTSSDRVVRGGHVYPSQLGPEQRRDALARMASETLDVLVIGGGVTGAGAAFDAATRGLAVGLGEARDYASGTSSRSSKLIHGARPHLQHRNL